MSINSRQVSKNTGNASGSSLQQTLSAFALLIYNVEPPLRKRRRLANDSIVVVDHIG